MAVKTWEGTTWTRKKVAQLVLSVAATVGEREARAERTSKRGRKELRVG